MRYRRALFVVDPGKDAGPALSVLRRVAPRLEHLVVHVPAPGANHSLAALRAAAEGVAATIELQVAPELGSDALTALCAAEEIDLLVFSSRSFRSASLVSLRSERLPVAVLWALGGPAPGPIQKLGCVALDERARLAIGAFLRVHADASMQVALLSPTPLAPDVLEAALAVSGVEAEVEASSPLEASSMRQWFTEWTQHRRIDLLVFTRITTALALGPLWTAPILLVPQLTGSRPFGERAIDVPDLVDAGGPLRVRVDQVAAVGSLAAIRDQPFAFVSAGRVLTTVTTEAGEATLPAGLTATSLGVYRSAGGAPADPAAAIEQWVAVVRPGTAPLVLFDAELPDPMLRAMTGRFEGAEFLAVRLRPARSCRALRARLRELDLAPRVVDARAVLDEGEALDVSDLLDPVRLARVAARLQQAGFPVSAIVHPGPVPPVVEGFVAVSGPTLEPDPSTAAVNAAPIEGNRIELELDNATARGWLLEAIGRCRQTLHLQVYMALDDEVGRQVEAALSAAGARGVTVRVLVDSLHGLFGSFGTRNPLFERLSTAPGVELRASRPITELPSITDLKLRDHRKLVIADGQLALLGGRNLSHEYYTGFGEVPLTAASSWREVPWLDGGARVEGPAVAALASSFLEAWTEAGGAQFEVAVPAAAGSSSARVVVHRGLREARTLEAYLAMIETARSHVCIVNGFPLVLELQHALVRALRRGVKVRTLIGHMTPTHAGQPFGGAWATARTFATELVHSRMDPVISAGAEVYVFGRSDLPGWAPGLGVVRPHVHAKAMSADGLRCAVGSANLDVTASYWESEVMLVVEDPAVARVFEAQVEALMAGSSQVKSDDPEWQRLARRRAWMRHWPGVLSV